MPRRQTSFDEPCDPPSADDACARPLTHDPAHFLPSFVWRADREGVIRYVNPWTSRYLGRPAAELVGLHWRGFVHPDDVEPVLDAVRGMRDGTLPGHVEVRLLRADGEFRWHVLHLQAELDANGRVRDTMGVAIDVHDARRAWEMYEAGERRLQAAFAGARMGAWEWDMNSRVARVTPQLAALYAFPPGTETVRLDGLWDRVAPEHRAAFQQKLDDALKRGRPFDIDFKLAVGSLEPRWLRMRGNAELDENGVLARVYGVTFDISEQRAAEEQLSLSERRYRALVEATGALMWSAAPNGDIRPAGDDWRRFTGDDVVKLSDWGWLDYVHPDDRATAQREWSDVMRRREPGSSVFRIRRYDGQYRTVRADAAPLFDSNGELQEWFGTTTDVTAQHEAQAAIEAHNLRLTVAMQAARLSIITLDLASRTVAFEAGTGARRRDDTLSYDEALARVHPDDRATLERYLRRVADGEEPGENFEFRLLDAQGERWMQGSALLQRGEYGKPVGLIASVLDITQRKQLELMLREADRRKDEFLAMLAHELRNPLAPLRTAIALLDKQPLEAAGTRERAHGLIELMHRQVEHMTRIVDDLLEVSRITQGRIVLQLEPVLVGTAVYHAVEAIAPMAESRHQHLQVKVCDPTTWVCGDITRIAQIFVNILNNASKYTPEGGDIAVSVEADDESVAIVIRDTGTGISAELLPKVFELFSQGERTLDRSNGGLGIGLSLVKKLVEMHHGTIAVASDGPNLGTTVTVRLPRLQHHERHHARHSAVALAQAAPGEAHSALRVLIVDDNRDAADSLAMLCESDGHATCVAYSSAEALESAPPFSPDIALLDIGLPDIDGYELARQLRRKGVTKPLLVAITGYGQTEDRLRAQAAGFDYHFVKPVNVDSLLKLLASAIVGQ